MFGLLRRLLFIALVIGGAVYIYNTYGASILAKKSPQSKKIADNVLGAATKFASDQASHSASLVDMFIFKQTTKPIIDQYNKLPKDKQQEIKNQICK